MILLSLVLLASSGDRPAIEVAGGLVTMTDGHQVLAEPGDCLVPKERCVAYAKQFEACKASDAVFKANPPAILPWHFVLSVAVAFALGVGVGLAIY